MPDPSERQVAERSLALLKAREILTDHIERQGPFTAEELAEGQAAWAPTGQAATISAGP